MARPDNIQLIAGLRDKVECILNEVRAACKFGWLEWSGWPIETTVYLVVTLAQVRWVVLCLIPSNAPRHLFLMTSVCVWCVRVRERERTHPCTFLVQRNRCFPSHPIATWLNYCANALAINTFDAVYRAAATHHLPSEWAACRFLLLLAECISGFARRWQHAITEPRTECVRHI